MSTKAPQDESKIGQPHPCEQCGQPGEWGIDPYREEIAGVRVVVALCREHFYQAAQDI